MEHIWVFNVLGIIFGLKLLHDFGPIFRNSRTMVKGNIDLVEVSYHIIVFSMIGNATFIFTKQWEVFQLLGGMASCFIHLFLSWALRTKCGKFNKKHTH